MQGRGNDQGRIWLLSGTGEGPPLAAALLRAGWRVDVSVVTPSAARSYAGLALNRILLDHSWVEAIEAVLKGTKPTVGLSMRLIPLRFASVRIRPEPVPRVASLCCGCNGRWSREVRCSCWISSMTCGVSL